MVSTKNDGFTIMSVYFSLPAESDFEQSVRSTASGGGFVTFPESDQPPKCAKPLYFVGSNTTGTWSCSLPDEYIKAMGILKQNIKNFDVGLKWIIFGKGGTHIYQFANRFLACLEGEHEDESNVLNKVRFLDLLW